MSVVIPTYNRGDVVRRAIDSVLQQDFKEFEVIVVDDGSTDNTYDVLEAYKRRIRCVFQEHAGVSAARNRGIRSANGELIAFLDSDDEWLPSKLTRQVERHSRGKTYFICHTDEIWMRQGRPVPQKAIHRKQGGHFFERALERCLISPSSAMMSSSLLEKVGGFDENLPAAEDYDLWLRVTAFHEVDFVPEALVIKHGGRSDQLSATTVAIDQYRIRAILKILSNPDLPPGYRESAVHELRRKCGIVAQGCRKRGKEEEANAYEQLAEAYSGALPRSR
ncbi:MAG: glycosyltransferase family A protein [Desulfomonilaceae bacterium]